ncbi:MAG: hypothetical protein NTY19_39940 [Planctomycetota bacterium]|nr:hypothetical protein [Planctomycetota bacterium]
MSTDNDPVAAEFLNRHHFVSPSFALWAYFIAEERQQTLVKTLNKLRTALAQSDATNAEIQRGLGNLLRAAHYFAQAADRFDDLAKSTHSQLMARMLLSDVTPVSLSNENSGMSNAVFSRDEKRILMWQGDTVRFLDRNGREIWRFVHKAPVHGAHLSRDEARLLTWSRDGCVTLWDTAVRTPLSVYRHQDAVRGAVFSRDESRVLTWSEDNTVALWDIATGSRPIQLLKHEGVVLGAMFSDDEKAVLTWSEDKNVRLWNFSTDRPIRNILSPDDIESVMLSTDSSMVVIFSSDSLSLWNSAGNMVSKIQIANSLFGRDTLFFGSGSPILSFGKRGDVELWDLTSVPPISNGNMSLWLQSRSGTRLVNGSLGVLTQEEWSKASTDQDKVRPKE